MNLIQPSNVLPDSGPSNALPCAPAAGGIGNAEQQNAGLEKTKTATPADHVEQPPKGTINIETIPTSSISLNDYNPNQMTPKEFKELMEEIRHLGRLPQPLVVRRQGDRYVIVNGAHGLLAAKKLGHVEVPCEVIDIDDFEAMRQTYKRNCHGTNNQVLLGRMYERMMSLGNFTQRALAKEMNVSEGTIRNALSYAKACDLRNDYAPDDAVDKIAAQTVEQVRIYLALPKEERDPWLDDGANLKTAGKLLNKPTKARAGAKSVANTSTEPATSPSDQQTRRGTQGAGSEDALHTEKQIEVTTSAPTPDAPQADEQSDNNAAATSAPAQAVSEDEPNPEKTNTIKDAWNNAGESERRAFLRTLREDPSAITMIKEEIAEVH